MMKKLLFSVLLLLMTVIGAVAQVTVTIGEGTSYQSYPLPGYYGWNYNVFLYTPTAAAALGADCDISSIAFNVSTNSTATGSEMKIWVKDVDADYALAAATTFGEYTTGATLVYESNDLSTTAGWNTFDFISDFSHEGGNALLVAVRGEGCSTSGGCSRSCYYTTATNTYWFKNQDNSDPGTDVSGSLSGNRANIQLELTYTGAVCLSPSGLNATAITHNSATLSWSENGNATAWVLQYGTDNTFASGTYTEASVNNPTTNLTGLNALTTYYVRVKPDCDTDGSHWSSSISFTTTAVATEVGDSWSDNFEGATCEWELINGTLTNAWAWGTAANNGGTHALYVSNDNGFTNEYSDGGTMVYATKLLSFATGKYEFSYDWKANGESTWDFLRVALVPASVTLSAGTTLPTGLSSNAVPTGWIALDGGSKLNLVDTWQTAVNAVNVTAGNYYLVFAWRNDSGGGTQPPAAIDNVGITRIACAYDVTNLAVSNISTITWTAGEASQWQVAYSTSRDFAGATEQIVSTASCNMTSLTSASTYYVKVRAYCGGTDFGAWSSVLEFNTACDAITSYPWSENFDGYTLASTYTPSSRTLPICWNYINECTYNDYKYYPTIYYYSNTDYSHSTPNSLRLYSYYYYSSWTDYDPQPQYAILPAMENLSTKRIELWAKGYNTSSTFKIGLMTDPSDARTFVQVGEEHALTTSYQKFTVDLTGTGNYIAIMIDAANSSRTYNGMYIDDITVMEQPSCMEPTALSASNVLAREVILSWTAGASETAWQICLNDDEDNLINADSNPFTLTGLTPETNYQVKVRAKCSESDYSEWTSNISFTTTVACPAPTALVFSDITNNYVSMSWTAGSSESRWNLQYKKSSEEDWSDVIEVTTNPITNISGLDAGTTYNVRVQANCELDGTSGTWLTGSFSTLYGIPFVEEFGTSIPANWANKSGLLDNVMTGTALTNGGNWNFGSGSNGVFDDHARVNIYGTSKKDWLLTPTIVMDANVQLTFDLALTAFSGTGAASGNCDDDKFVVLISTDNGETWTILRQYDNAGSEDVYNDIPTAGVEVTIDLSSYATDNVIIAFYGESTVYGGDNNLHIDNVSLDYRRSCTKPTALTVSNVLARTADLAWTAGADETAWQICLNDVEDDEHLINVNGEPSYTLTGLTPEYAYTVKVRANCGGDVSAWTANSSFTTAVSCPAPTALAATLTPGNGSVATLTWTENGTATAWTLEYGTAADFAGAISVDVNETPSAELTGLTAETTYYARVRTVCGVDDESAWSDVINFTPTDAYAITLNDGTTTNSYVPVYGLYVDDHSRSQFIIPASALTALQWGTINKLTFYSSNTSVNWGAAQFDVRLKEVNNTTFENSTLEDWNNMSLVYNGSLTISDNIMEITFSTPYTYMGGNLMIGTNCIVNGTYASCSWYGVSADGASLGGYNTSISQRNFLPKVTIEYTPGAEPTCYVPTALAASNVTNESATITWTVGASETAWQICINNNEEELINVTETSYTLNDLTAATTYSVKVRANCGEGDVSAWSTVMFTTNLCADEDMCQISYELSDPSGEGYGWYGAAINVIDAETSMLLATWTLEGGELSTTGTLSVCNGRDITFEWVEGVYGGYYDDYVTAYAVYDVNGVEIFSGTGALLADEEYTVDCTVDYCSAPISLDADVTNTTANLSWNGNSDNYVVRYRSLTPVFFDNFENGLGNWTIYTEGDDGAKWKTINPMDGLSKEAHSGDSVAAAFSWSGSAYNADNWLVTSQIALGGVVKFWVNTNGGYPDHYEVLLSLTGNEITDFTTTLRAMEAASGDWTEISIDLSEYDGMGYIAIHHEDYDANYLLVDDFGLYTPGEWTEVNATGTSLEIVGLTPATNYEYQVLSQCEDPANDNWSVMASFITEPNTYIITASAGENGAIYPEGEVVVIEGESQEFEIVANPNYRIASVLVDDEEVVESLDNGVYTFTNVSANHSIVATFVQSVYTITATAGDNGTITPDGDVPVDENGDQAFTIEADDGYRILSVLVDGAEAISELVDGVYTFTNVTADHTIAATFVSETATTHTITATAGENGTITPSGAIEVVDGESKEFRIEAATGYHIASVMVDDVEAIESLVDGVYTFTNVTADHTIAAAFAINNYIITATAGENGTITPEEVAVIPGENAEFTITPAEGYRIATVVVDAETEDEANVANDVVAGEEALFYTFENVTANHTINVTFELIPTYTITVNAGENGNVYYNDALVSAPIVVTEGATPAFEITPETGYEIDVLTVGGNTVDLTEQQLGGFTYTFDPVMADITLAVTFTFVNSADMIEAGSISIYPNPNNGMFSIDFSNIEGDATYQIIDARGAVVETRDINVMNGETMNFNHDLRPGAYFVRIINGDKVYVEQIVVE